MMSDGREDFDTQEGTSAACDIGDSDSGSDCSS